MGIERKYLNIIKATNHKLTANIPNGEKEYPVSPLLFNIVLEVAARATR